MYICALFAFLAISQINADVFLEENFNDSKY